MHIRSQTSALQRIYGGNRTHEKVCPRLKYYIDCAYVVRNRTQGFAVTWSYCCLAKPNPAIASYNASTVKI
jgi:hypothetical protein